MLWKDRFKTGLSETVRLHIGSSLPSKAYFGWKNRLKPPFSGLLGSPPH